MSRPGVSTLIAPSPLPQPWLSVAQRSSCAGESEGFREALRAVVARIAENPKQFLTSSHQTRRALLRHFPYLVIFRETPQAAYVVAVFHTSRDLRTWQQRIL